LSLYWSDGNAPIVHAVFADSSRFVHLCLGSGCGTGSAKPGIEQEFEMAFAPFPENAAASYLWPEGTCTQEAARFFSQDTAMLRRETVPDATADVTAGNTDFAARPQENTLGGAVTNYTDAIDKQKQECRFFDGRIK